MTTRSTRSRSVARAGFAGRSSGALGRGRSRSRCCTACLNELSVQVPNALYLLGGQVLVYVYTFLESDEVYGILSGHGQLPSHRSRAFVEARLLDIEFLQ